jgi:hypothetical protein
VLEVIGEEFTSYVYTSDMFPDDLTVSARQDVAVGVTYIEDDGACGRDVLVVTE